MDLIVSMLARWFYMLRVAQTWLQPTCTEIQGSAQRETYKILSQYTNPQPWRHNCRVAFVQCTLLQRSPTTCGLENSSRTSSLLSTLLNALASCTSFEQDNECFDLKMSVLNDRAALHWLRHLPKWRRRILRISVRPPLRANWTVQ